MAEYRNFVKIGFKCLVIPILLEVEREVRSRITGAMEAATEKRERLQDAP